MPNEDGKVQNYKARLVEKHYSQYYSIKYKDVYAFLAR